MVNLKLAIIKVDCWGINQLVLLLKGGSQISYDWRHYEKKAPVAFNDYSFETSKQPEAHDNDLYNWSRNTTLPTWENKIVVCESAASRYFEDEKLDELTYVKLKPA